MAALNLAACARAKKAVLIDLDNTLYAYAPCHRVALRNAYSAYRRASGRLKSFRTFVRAYERAKAVVKRRTGRQAASHSRLLYFQAMLEGARNGAFFKTALSLEQAYWSAFLKKMRRFGWVLPFLKRMKAAGKRVVVVTDLTTEIQLRKLVRLGLSKWIDAVASSEEAGAEKPDARLLRLALRKAHCRAHDALLIGDDPARDRSPLIPSLLISEKPSLK